MDTWRHGGDDGGQLGGAEIALPTSMRKPMIAVVGVALGSSFTPDRLSGFADWLPSLASIPVYLAVIGCLILLYLRRVSSFDAKTAFFAATPGGLSEMVILSDQLGGDMRNVALFHTARLVLIVFSIPLIAQFVVTSNLCRRSIPQAIAWTWATCWSSSLSWLSVGWLPYRSACLRPHLWDRSF